MSNYNSVDETEDAPRVEASQVTDGDSAYVRKALADVPPELLNKIRENRATRLESMKSENHKKKIAQLRRLPTYARIVR